MAAGKYLNEAENGVVTDQYYNTSTGLYEEQTGSNGAKDVNQKSAVTPPYAKMLLVNNLSLRDTTTHSSTTDSATIKDWDLTTVPINKGLQIYNGTDQTITVTVQHGWQNAPGARVTFTISVPANSNVWKSKTDFPQLSDPSVFLAVTVAAAIAPTTGSINIYGIAASS